MVAIAGILISVLVLIAGLLPSYLEARFSTLTKIPAIATITPYFKTLCTPIPA
jgi:hypothetical protein